MFLMSQNPFSNFKVTLRTDGISYPSPSQTSVHGIEIQFNILDDDGTPSNNLKIYAGSDELAIVAANLTLDTWHSFLINDDGTNISLFFDGSLTPAFSVQSAYRYGNKIALFTREGAGNGSSISANGITEISYLTIANRQLPNSINLTLSPFSTNINVNFLTMPNNIYYIQLENNSDWVDLREVLWYAR